MPSLASSVSGSTWTPAAGVDPDASGLHVEPFAVGLAPGRDHELVAGDRAAVVAVDVDLAAIGVDLVDVGGTSHLQAGLDQLLLDELAGFWLLGRQHPGSGLEEVHLAAKAKKRLRDLDSGGAGADNHESRRQFSGQHPLPGGPRTDVFDAWDASHHRLRPGCDHDSLPGHQFAVTNGHGAGTGEPALTADDGVALVLDGLGRTGIVEVAGHHRGALVDLGIVDVDLDPRCRQLGRSTNLRERLSTPQ